MTKYKCFRCGYTNVNKSVFLRHIKRKFKCKPFIKDIDILNVYKYYFENENIDMTQNDSKMTQYDSKMTQNDSKMTQYDSKMTQNDSKMTQNDSKMTQNDSNKKYICEYCNRTSSRKNNLVRHYTTCKIKKAQEEKERKDEEFQEKLQLALDEMEQNGQLIKLDQPLAKLGSTQNDFSQNNNGTINHFNITINPYEKTDWSYITRDNVLTSIQKGNFGIPYMIKLLHFNKDKPENHNICVKNIKSKYISVYNGDQWDCQLQYEQISIMAEEVINYIEDQISEWDDKFYEENKEKVKKFNFFQNKYYDSKKTYVHDRVHEEMKLGLFNNRELIMGTHDKLLELNSV